MPEFQDRCVVCLDCGGTFIWTAGEQLFYAEKGLTYPPKRCKPCKQRRNTRLTATACSQARHDADERVEAKVLCADCGVPHHRPLPAHARAPGLLSALLRAPARSFSN